MLLSAALCLEISSGRSAFAIYEDCPVVQHKGVVGSNEVGFIVYESAFDARLFSSSLIFNQYDERTPVVIFSSFL